MSRPLTDEPNKGAMQQLAQDGSSRRRFLALVGGTGAAGAFGIFLAACGDDDNTSRTSTTDQAQGGGIEQFGEGDLGILNYALTLEYLEADFYKKAADSGILKGDALALGRQFGRHEQEHVDALKATVEQMGGTPAKKPKTDFPLESQDAILELAATVENLGSAAYLGQAGRIKDKKVLAAALSIHTVEGRHAAALNSVIGKSITPDGSFALPANADKVLKEVQPFIVS